MMRWNFLALTLIFHVNSWASSSIESYFNYNQAQSYEEPYRNITRPGDNLEQVILNQIYSAKKSIYLAVQELRLPLVARALVEKYQQGIDVRVVLEHDYNYNVLGQRDSGGDQNEYEASKLAELRAFVDLNQNGWFEKEELLKRDAIYILQDAQIPLMDDTADMSAGSGLMHHKFMIVDGVRTIVSTANFTMSCIHGDFTDSESRGNPNSMIVITSTSAAKIFLEEFYQLWGNGRRGNFGLNKTYRGPQKIKIRNTELTIQFSPTSRRFNWAESVNGLIADEISKAEVSVHSALFAFSDQNLANAMHGVHAKGASIGVIVEPKFAFRDYSELLDLMGLQMLGPSCSYEPDNNPWAFPAETAAMAIPNRGDVLHHKFAVIDGHTTIMGSQNWSDSANHVNDETLIVIKHKKISDNYTKEYERVKKSARIGPPKWLKQSIKQREKDCSVFGPQN